MAAGQLYLIAGSPTPKSFDPNAAVILRIDDETKSVKHHEDVLDSEGIFTFVDVLPEKGIAVVARRIPDRVAFIDLNRARVAKTCDRGAPGMVNYQEWVAEIPNGSVALLSKYGDQKASGSKGITAVTFDDRQSCEGGAQPIPTADLRLPLCSGAVVIPSNGTQEPFRVTLESNGTMRTVVAESSAYFAPQIPSSWLQGPRAGQSATLLVNNGSLIALNLGTGENIIALYRKSDASWHKIAKHGDGNPAVRAFGRFIVITEAHTRSTVHKESAGREAWRKGRSAHGPAVARAFDEAREVYPGVLHIRDIESQKAYRIQTDQADSEVVLIEGNQVYYRVSDELFRAELTAKGTISIGMLVAKSELLLDAHWAFFSK